MKDAKGQNGTNHLKERVSQLETELSCVQEEANAEIGRLNDLFQNAPLGYQSLNEFGDIIEVNKTWLDNLGYRREEVIGRNFGEFLPDDSKQNFKKYFPRFKAIGEILGVEFELVRKDGTLIPVAFNGRIAQNEDGSFKQTHCIFRDTTPEKKAEEMVQKHHEKSIKLFNDVLDAMSEMVWLKDPNGVYLMCNQELADLVKLRREEIIGGTDYDIFPKEKADSYGEHDRAAIENRETTVNEESADYLKDGYSIWIETSKTPVYDKQGELIGILGVGRDISRRKQALKESEEKQAFLNMVVDSSPIPMWIGSPNGTLLRGNEAFFHTLQLERGHAIGKYSLLKDDNFKQPEMSEQIDQLLNEGLSVRFDGAWDSELAKGVTFSKRGRFHFDISIYPLLNQAGEMTHIVAQWVDITERKRFEGALLESEKRFRDLTHSMADWAWEVDAQGRYTFATDRVHSILGYHSDELIGHTPFDFMAPDNVDFIREEFRLISAQRAPIVNLENWNIHKDGSRVCLMTSGIPMFGAGGELVGYRGVDKDVTTRKLAEMALRKSEERYRMLAENSHDMIYRMRVPEGVYEYVSPASSRLFGHTPEEFMANNLLIRELIHPDWADYFKENWQQACDGEGSDTFEYMIVRHGEECWIYQRNVYYKNELGEVYAMEAIVTDITERKNAENAAIESEKLFRSVFEQAAVGMAQVGLDGGWLKVNRRLCEIVGYGHDEMMSLTFQDITHPDDLASDLAYVQGLLDGKFDTYSMEKRYFHKEGHVVWVYLTVAVVRENEADPRYFVSVIEDITPRKHAEFELAETERRLALAQKLEAVGSLAAGIAHEINTPLQYIKGNLTFLEAFAKDLSAFSDLTSREYSQFLEESMEDLKLSIEESKQGVDHVSKIVTSMKSIAHPSTDEVRAVDVNDVISHIINVSRNVWKYYATVETRLDEDMPLLSCNPGEIIQVLLNLIQNASQAIEEKYAASSEKGCITIQSFRDSESIHIVVRDDGVGIPQAHLPRIFDQFFTTKDVGKGTGQGLSIVYSIIQKHNGTIRCISEEGVGTSFVVKLPQNHV